MVMKARMIKPKASVKEEVEDVKVESVKKEKVYTRYIASDGKYAWRYE